MFSKFGNSNYYKYKQKARIMRKYSITKMALVLFLLPSWLVSCSSNQLDVDVSEVDYAVQFYHLDRDLVKAKNIEDVSELNRSYEGKMYGMYNYYLSSILRSGYSSDPGIEKLIFNFSTNKKVNKLLNDVDQEIDRELLSEELEKGFKRLKYHLPEANLPHQIVYWNSLFTTSAISSDSVLAIGLERYLGISKEYDSLPSPPHYDYVKNKYFKRYLYGDAAKSWLIENVLPKNKRESFLQELIYQGKLMYLTEAMFPDKTKADLLRFSDEDVNWAIQKERNTWEYMVKNNLVYTTESARIRDFFNVSPFTQGLPEKAPGQIGVYMGWMIVRSYMEENPDATIKDLIAIENEQTILKAYKINE